MTRFQHSRILYSLLTLTILASCDGVFPEGNGVFSSENMTTYQTALTPQVPYLNQNYLLPSLTLPSPTVTWSVSNGMIADGIYQYVSPQEDQTVTFTATLSSQGETRTLEFPMSIQSQLQVPEVSKRPILNLTLANGKGEADIFYEDYLNATASVTMDRNGEVMTQSIVSPLGIRTRGHSTRFMPKRPYRIRFEQNTSLFGMKEAKNYILLANYLDRSLVRNSLVAYMSKFYSTMYTLDYRFVDLKINQTYFVQYLLIERVEFHKNRLNIEPDLTKDDAGFMIELDYQVYVQNQGNENLEWFRMNDTPYTIKEPNPLDPDIGYQFRHTRFINNFLHSTRDALISRTNYADYLDTENWLDYFLIQEITKNVDVGWGSVYLVKPTGEKIKHMPLWDFDLAIGLAEYDDIKVMDDPDGHWGWATYEKNYLFTLLMKIPAMRQRFREKLADYHSRLLPKIDQWLDDNLSRMTALSSGNFEVWPMNACSGWCPISTNIRDAQTMNQQFDYLSQFLHARVDWMMANI